MAELYGGIGPAVEMSGGSCANTMAALASLGARAAYVGKVQRDQLGEVFTHDVRAAGVDFRTSPLDDGPPTARSFILVTPDAQRTMSTYLGACVELGPGRRRRGRGRRRQHHLSGGLSLGPAEREGGLPEGRSSRASPRPPGGTHPVRPVLRGPLARRVRRPDRAPRRHRDRQRGRDLQPVWRRPLRGCDRRRAPPDQNRGADPGCCRLRDRRGRADPCDPGGADRAAGRHHRRRRPLRRGPALRPHPRPAARSLRTPRQPLRGTHSRPLRGPRRAAAEAPDRGRTASGRTAG